ncbi:MAG: carbohydrate-binding domain-containing protein [Lachnospiraceae bacterium]|nr:carbohydrate-binding domain-containing protein [Lachnospiraceae bacterium]
MLAILLLGCSNQNNNSVSNDSNQSVIGMDEKSSGTVDENNDDSPEVSVSVDISEIFSARDFEVGYDESESAIIQLNGDTAICSSNAVQISGSTITIIDEGIYILSGTLDNGMIIVNSEKTDKTQLVLNNVTIHSETSAPIYIMQSDKVFITMAAGTTNTLSNGGAFEAIDENSIDAVIFSKEDITLNGSGTLIVTSPVGHGIVSKDSLTITSGSYDINCASHALVGKDDVCIANGDFTIVSGKDGIHAENADDAAAGFVYILNGTYSIAAEGDGISAAAYVQIGDGAFNITSGGGSANALSKTSDSWGNFMGGGKHQGGKHPDGNPGGFHDDFYGGDSSNANDTSDSTSIKGIKATTTLTIDGGAFVINSADDAVHSNTDVIINGGTFEIASGDDAFHADETLTITDGKINITESYEGLEGLHVVVSGGDITLVANDDGLNAAGGTDASGITGGRDGMLGHGMSSSSDGSIVISGGTINVTAYGDGIDANGTLDITGGCTTVCGPTQGDTATLDYDIRATISGGTFIGTGALGMAQTFSDSEQGVIALNVGNQSANTEIKLTDSDGNTVITHVPDLSFGVVILSSPDIIKGETYTITVGSTSGEFTAN